VANGTNENGVPTPPNIGGGNGVSMPGPMGSGYEDGWGFNGIGIDMSNVVSSPAVIEGVQMPGGNNEQGWAFGQDFSNLAPEQSGPPTNQNFGDFSDSGAMNGQEDANGTHLVGRFTHDNTDGVQASDVLSVFNALTSNGGSGSWGGPVPGHDSLAGIPLGAGSGPYAGGEQNTNSTGSSPVRPTMDTDQDGY
jgi:hypothetical protein